VSDARILIGHKGIHLRCELRGAFERSGFTCDEASHGHQALQMIEAGSYEVAVLQARLPWLNGWHVLERSRPARPDLGVVIFGGPPITVQDWRVAVLDDSRSWLEIIPTTLDMFTRRALRRAA
jgi:DNA-binding response OmpR family regulator